MNSQNKNNISILIAEDDPDDRLLIKEAFEENKIANPLHFVGDGVELLEFLCHQGPFAEFANDPLPALIILDLNMPRVDGREILEVLKSHHRFKTIPIVTMTTSNDEADMKNCYEHGANAYVIKPSNFEQLSKIISTMAEFWLNFVSQPKPECRVSFTGNA